MTTIAIGGIMHESNTFSDTPTDYAAFSHTYASNIIKTWGESHHEIGGFIQGATDHNYTAYPMMMASATPAGPVTDDAFDRLTDMLIQHLKSVPQYEGVLLALHGAMVAESYPDGDGEVLRRLRDALGRDLPIVVTLDQHANVSEQMVAESTALVIYKTTPHIDQRQRGLQAAELMMRILQGRGESNPSTRQTADAPQYPVSRHECRTHAHHPERRKTGRARSQRSRIKRCRGIPLCRCP